jgi:hypothetical protein
MPLREVVSSVCLVCTQPFDSFAGSLLERQGVCAACYGHDRQRALAVVRDLIHATLWSRVTLQWLCGRSPSPCTVAARRILKHLG